MVWLDHKYMAFVASRLRNYKKKSGRLYNMACPFCGDSKTKKSKARAYVYEKDHKLFFFCHNLCGGMSFRKFLRRVDEGLYSEYMLESLQESRPVVDDSEWKTVPEFAPPDALKSLLALKKINQLPPTHPARKYLAARQIPVAFQEEFRWCPAFMLWTNARMKPGKFKEEDVASLDEGRIVIPFFSKDKNFFAYIGRAISSTELRYIMIVLDYETPAVWGAERIDFLKPITAVEGPIDATFLKNTLAMAGSNMGALTKVASRDSLTVVFDNEPNSIDTKKKIAHAIDNGFAVGIWPDNLNPKDINAMVLAGYSSDHIEYLISKNTFSGIAAKMRLEQWSRR